MATIDKLDIGIYIQYARFTQLVEEIQKDYQFTQAGSIPPQTLLLNLYPKPSEVDMLLGTLPVYAQWAYFRPPMHLGKRRRSIFTFSRVMPTIGSYEEEEQQEQRLDWSVCQTAEEEAEKAVLKRCFEQIKKINGWIGFIVGRVGQFLQG